MTRSTNLAVSSKGASRVRRAQTTAATAANDRRGAARPARRARTSCAFAGAVGGASPYRSSGTAASSARAPIPRATAPQSPATTVPQRLGRAARPGTPPPRSPPQRRRRTRARGARSARTARAAVGRAAREKRPLIGVREPELLQLIANLSVISGSFLGRTDGVPHYLRCLYL